MADSILLIWLEGPLQSWGTRARWDVRDTGLEPTKSGIIGLLGCALGLRRDNPEMESLDRELLFGVRIDRPGVVSTDYQTVTGYHRTAAGDFKHSGGTAKSLAKAMEHGESTVVSPRDYLHDAIFLAALAGQASRIQTLKQALTTPHWPLYLGRKSCLPTRPPLDHESGDFSDLQTALANRSRHHRARQGNLAAYVEDPAGTLVRQDALRINQLRMYEFRNCNFMEVDPPCSSQD